MTQIGPSNLDLWQLAKPVDSRNYPAAGHNQANEPATTSP